jgi:hypothetical protein
VAPTAPTTGGLPAPDLESYRPHPLHLGERDWTETNCYVDAWIEVLHALGLEPLAAAAFTLSADFEDPQWSLFKFPLADLRFVFGVEVSELHLWRPVVEQVSEQLDLGRLCTVEVDAFYLPDTRGLSYRLLHVKTTIVPCLVDPVRRRLGYFHGDGYHELADDDFDGLFRLGDHDDPSVIPPYVELIRLEGVRRHPPELVDRAVALTRSHLARRPPDNPVTRLGDRLVRDMPWLSGQDLETFHRYSFGTCRQCGSNAELAASFVEWLNRSDRPGTETAAEDLRQLSSRAKALQFALARVVRGREVDVTAILSAMERHWSDAMATLADRYGT